jgi:hypothetical protein
MLKRAILVVMFLGSAAQADDKMAKMKMPSDAELIKAASTAAPPEITKNATYLAGVPEGESMKVRQLKAGTNGWVCAAMVMGPKPEVMCADKVWQGWFEAYMAKKDPPAATQVGVAYMLAGDQGVSNTDPFAMAPTADNHWVVTGPHTMLLLPDAKMLDAYPSDPMAGGPYVMWKGTKYAHVMVPVAEMPKQPAPKK